MRRKAYGAVSNRKGLRLTTLLASGIASLSMASGANAARGMDCPLAHQAYSSQSLLIDLMINPATKAVLQKDLGPLFARLPAMMTSTTPPSFAAIVTPRELLGLAGTKDVEASAAQLDRDLKSVALTPADVRARCARYDETPPVLPAEIPHPAILVFDKINGFKDGPSVAAATQALKSMAARRGWTLIFSNNGAVFNRRDLSRFDAIVWNNVSGDVLTVPQERAFQAYLSGGGGYAGIHGAGGDPVYAWPWYPDVLLGARFAGHPLSPQFQQATVSIEEPETSITRGLAPGWSMTEEWYSFKTNPRASGSHVLATLDEKSYRPVGFGGQDLRMGDHPIAWRRCIGNGRSFYTAIGHRPESYTEPHAVMLLEQGIAWAAKLGDSQCSSGRETPIPPS